ncbi:methylglyoxal synthase [Noviherbaspirillum aridicola]|uniref:Methylglyoxal synthase n=1 Tax=Noviherbaspirillum aridicola TaxID=2849687 RepID=A0ABQ4Q1N3_9BURK|nr:methylglyoxal synthase [Noviherbaspirillum aridicola]GIZ51093.1 methylglyoxal synthase [Noviherbaspirillum aridicola]
MPVPPAPSKRIGLAANRSHHADTHAALSQLLTHGRDAIEHWLQPTLVVVGRTMDAIENYGLLPGYGRFERFPYGREGGLMMLVSRVVDPVPARGVDAVIYLIDPVDPSSSFPEASALKRQCIIHGKPFLSTLASAREWLDLEAMVAGAPGPGAGGPDLEEDSIALIAHDAMKGRMIEIAEKHFELLDRFALRHATGTTGALLNELAVRRKGKEGEGWVKPLLSGPMGGDAQIAELILRRQCGRVIFLEDPHVARQHEADIQLLERAVRTVTEFAVHISDARTADRWLSLLGQYRAAPGRARPRA